MALLPLVGVVVAITGPHLAVPRRATPGGSGPPEPATTRRYARMWTCRCYGTSGRSCTSRPVVRVAVARGIRVTATGTGTGRTLGHPQRPVRPQSQRRRQRRHDAPARPARDLLRRRHADHDRARRHDLLQRPRRRGPRPGRAVPARDHGPVRAPRPRRRPGAGPVPPRAPVRPGRHHARPRLPRLGHRRQPARLRPLPGRLRGPRPLPGLRRRPQCRRAPAAAAGARAVPGRRAGVGLRHRRRGHRRADRRRRLLVRPPVAAARRQRDLPRRSPRRARPPAAGRLRPARGRTQDLPPSLAAPGPERRQDPLRPSGRRHPRGQRVPAGAVRLPAALPRVRDPGRGSPDRLPRPRPSPHRRPRARRGHPRPRHVPVDGHRHGPADPASGARAGDGPLGRRDSGRRGRRPVLTPDGRSVLSGYGHRQRTGQARRRRVHSGAHSGNGTGERVRSRRDPADARLGSRRRLRSRPLRRPDRDRRRGPRCHRRGRDEPSSRPGACATTGSLDASTPSPRTPHDRTPRPKDAKPGHQTQDTKRQDTKRSGAQPEGQPNQAPAQPRDTSSRTQPVRSSVDTVPLASESGASESDESRPPRYHVFQPTPPDSGVADPRAG